ncbi:MAG: YggU family protein [Methanomicrobiales archaeon]|nr:YggU family protein [Methanomicrobiales archaeon]
MTSFSDAISDTDEGVIIAIEVSAGAKQNRFPAGWNPWRRTVQCQVSAPPVGGKANRAIIDVVATATGIAKTRIRIVAGASSTQKKVLITGISREELLLCLPEPKD